MSRTFAITAAVMAGLMAPAGATSESLTVIWTRPLVALATRSGTLAVIAE